MAQSSFKHDMGAVDMLKQNRVVEVLPYALQEIQTRMISPLQALSWSKVRLHCSYALWREVPIFFGLSPLCMCRVRGKLGLASRSTAAFAASC